MSILQERKIADLEKAVQRLTDRVEDLEKQRIYDLTANSRETLKLKRG